MFYYWLMIKIEMFLNTSILLKKMILLTAEKQLRNLGLNGYEAKVWIALLSKCTSTAGELSDIANVPRSRCYDVLKSLEAKGFVLSIKGKPLKYKTSSPSEAIGKAKKRIHTKAHLDFERASKIKGTGTFSKLRNLYMMGAEFLEKSDLSSSLKGRFNLYNHIGNMISRAEKNICISTTPTEFNELIRKLMPLFEKISRKNINIKIICQIGRDNKKVADMASRFASIKNTIVKSRFVIIDGKEIIFMVLDDDEVNSTYDVGIWANTPLVKILENSFK